MGAISKESIQKSAVQLAAKRLHVEMMDSAPIAPSSQPSFTSAPSSTFKADVFLADIMEQLQHIHADFGSHLDHLSDEMCHMNTRINRIACCQSHLSGFEPSPSPKPLEKSSSGGDNDADADGSGSCNDVCILHLCLTCVVSFFSLYT